MKLIQRIGYYLGGFSIGLVILAFFLNGKKTSCSYGPEARVLKNINSKTILYSEIFQNEITSKHIDTTAISYVLKKGDIDFSKSDPRKQPCGLYNLEAQYNKQLIVFTIENCDSIATILKMTSD